MKMRLELDLTPKEARKLMGLPDVEAMQEKVVDLIFNEMKDGISDIKDPEKLLQRFMPIGQGLETLSKMMPDFVKFGSGDDDDSDDKKKGDNEKA